MQDLHPPFLPSATYHVYNHANGDDNIFREEDNYRYFMEKYQKYISPAFATLAYCLMKNHFHLMVRVKGELELFDVFKTMGKDLTGFENLSGLVSNRFSRLFNSYAKSFNLKYDRIGGLFNRPVKRKQITNDAYFTQCIVYIHQNPVSHGFLDDLADWKHSSYWGILKGDDRMVEAEEVIGWFGGVEKYIKIHEVYVKRTSVFD